MTEFIMTPALMEAFRLECAKREGWTNLQKWGTTIFGEHRNFVSTELPFYTTHDEIQRVIDGLSDTERKQYCELLMDYKRADGAVTMYHMKLFSMATIEQKQLALCAAWGLKGENK